MLIKENSHFKEQIFFIGKEGKSVVTDNCGESYEIFDHGKSIEVVKFHPIIKNKLLFTSRLSCEDSTEKNCLEKNELIFTEDLKEFKVLNDYVHNFDW